MPRTLPRPCITDRSVPSGPTFVTGAISIPSGTRYYRFLLRIILDIARLGKVFLLLTFFKPLFDPRDNASCEYGN